ncbi:hypothetical protein PQR70_14455 [Paraburkholderia madseniana]|jgi:hypothetical protein|uniref:hypothetical protein n=1 Tax=Paraburkholderia madseniana TaxID=2599607 RepID=UPI0038BE1ACE
MNRERILRLSMTLYHLRDLPDDQLVRIVKSKNRYSTHYRAAALRHLVAGAPLAVTGGQPFAERRRRVKRHYGI